MTQAANPAAANFDRTKAKSAVDVIQKAMSGLSTGYELEIGSGSFSGSELTVQLKIRIPGGVSQERLLLELECKHRGFDPDTTLKSSSYGEFNLVGYHPRRPKYPWTVQIVGGQRYKFTDEAITDAFNRLKN